MEPVFSNLIESNEATIKELDGLLMSIQQNISAFKETKSSCFEKLNELSKAWCRFPFGIFSEVYYYTLERPPFGSEFDVEIGSMGKQPDGWVQLTNTQKEEFEKELPDTEPIKNTIHEAIEKLRPLIQNAIDKNVIIKNAHDILRITCTINESACRWQHFHAKFR